MGVPLFVDRPAPRVATTGTLGSGEPLSAVVHVGAFDDEEVVAVLGLRPGETPLYLIPVCHVRAED